MPKALLRKALLVRRSALSAAEQAVAGDAIQAAFLATPQYREAASVALYCAVRNEVSTEKAITAVLSAGKALFLPAVDGGEMLFRRVTGRDELVAGRFGILQPDCRCPSAAPEEIDQFVIPGVGFDLGGQRIGYGKGYYDRTLHRLEGKGRMTAFCYEFQLVDSLAGEQHDVVMDRIITEHRLINTGSAKIKKEN